MRRCLPCLGLVLLASIASPAGALEATVFLSGASPADSWKTGYGGALTSTWFHVLALEAEIARQPLEFDAGSLLSFTGTAAIAPSLGRLTPYGGLGVGVFRQTLGSQSDNGTLKCFVLGLKVKLGLLVLKGDYRHYGTPSGALTPLEERLTIGGGISF